MRYFTFFQKWLPLIAVILALMFLFNYPALYALNNTPDGKVFAGHVSWFDATDTNVYIAAIKWSQKFKLHFQNAYTTKTHSPIIIYPLYTLLGILFPSANVFVIYHAFSIILGLILLIMIYRTSMLFLKERWAVLSMFLVPIAGGFGWLFATLGPPDLAWTPFTFTNVFQRPHEILAMTFYIAAYTLFYTGIVKNNLKKLILASVSLNLLTIFYPYLLLGYYITTFSFMTYLWLAKKFNKTKWKYYVIHILTTLPWGIFYSIYLKSSTGFLGVLVPKLPAPSLLYLLLGYGIFGFIFLFQLFGIKKDKSAIFLSFWLLINLSLVYTPLSFARFYLRGLFYPLVLLSLLTINRVPETFKVFRMKLVVPAILLVPITSIFIFGFKLLTVKQHSRWRYLTDSAYGAITYLNQNSSPGSGVLLEYPLANQLPAFTLNRVYWGHPNQTPDAGTKYENLVKFYSNKMSEDEADRFLVNNNIKYIIYSPSEKLHSEKNTLEYQFLKSIYSVEEYSIYSY